MHSLWGQCAFDGIFFKEKGQPQRRAVTPSRIPQVAKSFAQNLLSPDTLGQRRKSLGRRAAPASSARCPDTRGRGLPRRRESVAPKAGLFSLCTPLRRRLYRTLGQRVVEHCAQLWQRNDAQSHLQCTDSSAQLASESGSRSANSIPTASFCLPAPSTRRFCESFCGGNDRRRRQHAACEQHAQSLAPLGQVSVCLWARKALWWFCPRVFCFNARCSRPLCLFGVLCVAGPETASDFFDCHFLQITKRRRRRPASAVRLSKGLKTKHPSPWQSRPSFCFFFFESAGLRLSRVSPRSRGVPQRVALLVENILCRKKGALPPRLHLGEYGLSLSANPARRLTLAAG